MALRPFELKIISDFKTFSPVVGGGQAIPRKGVWIRGHLIVVYEDYVYSMFKSWLRFVAEAWRRDARIKPGTYTSFKTYTWLLTKYGLIIPTRRERGKSPRFLRQYYTYNPALLDDPRWENPYGEYESWRRERDKGFPR